VRESNESYAYARLVPCTEIDYAEFATLQLVEYARQLVNAGEVVPADGLVTARERLSDLTADRLRPTGHTFFVAESALDGSRIGWTWISPPPLFLGPGHERIYWLSQLTVLESHRRIGWGRAILDAIEHHLCALGAEELWLRVFNWNVMRSSPNSRPIHTCASALFRRPAQPGVATDELVGRFAPSGVRS